MEGFVVVLFVFDNSFLEATFISRSFFTPHLTEIISNV